MKRRAASLTLRSVRDFITWQENPSDIPQPPNVVTRIRYATTPRQWAPNGRGPPERRLFRYV